MGEVEKAKKLERIGLIVNPKAGKFNREIVKEVVDRLSPCMVYVGPAELGGYLRGFGFESSKVDLVELEFEPSGSAEDTVWLVRRFNEIDLDAVVVFGGDGTMSDASISKHPLLCIPTGTTNVSPLIFNDSTTFTVEEIDPTKFVIKEIDGLVVEIDGLYFNAFNDVVVGSTILSTINGRKTQIDAEAFLEGRKIESKPKKFHAKVEIMRGNEILKSIEGIFGNIFISLTGKRYLGKGIAGGVAISTFVGFKAAIACTNEGMICHYSKDELRSMEPFVTSTLSFDEGEKVRILTDGVVSRDGTPIKKGNVEVEFRERLVKVLKLLD